MPEPPPSFSEPILPSQDPLKAGFIRKAADMPADMPPELRKDEEEGRYAREQAHTITTGLGQRSIDRRKRESLFINDETAFDTQHNYEEREARSARLGLTLFGEGYSNIEGLYNLNTDKFDKMSTAEFIEVSRRYYELIDQINYYREALRIVDEAETLRAEQLKHRYIEGYGEVMNRLHYVGGIERVTREILQSDEWEQEYSQKFGDIDLFKMSPERQLEWLKDFLVTFKFFIDSKLKQTETEQQSFLDAQRAPQPESPAT